MMINYSLVFLWFIISVVTVFSMDHGLEMLQAASNGETEKMLEIISKYHIHQSTRNNFGVRYLF